jgi:hypothetical protein
MYKTRDHSQVTRAGTEGTAQQEPELAHFPSTIFQENDIAEIREHLAGLAKRQAAWENVVDERTPQTLVPWSVTQVQLTPNYEFPIFVKNVIITGPPTAASATFNADLQVTNPGANVNIASLGILPKGEYTANVTLELQGTVTAADGNNMKFVSQGATVIPVFQYPGIAGVYPQPAFNFAADGTSICVVKSIAAASGAAAIYAAEVTATPLSPPFTLQLGDRVWNLVLPSSGIMVIGCDPMTLERNDPRILSSSIAGPWGLEIIGFGDVRKRRY